MATTSYISHASSDHHFSYWLDSAGALPRFHPLDRNIHADAVIVGGGLAGVIAAYRLATEGKKIVVIEEDQIGGESTGHTTAQLVTTLHDLYCNLEKIIGEEGTHLVAKSHKSAIDFIEETTAGENIECLFERVDGYLLCHPAEEKEIIAQEFTAASSAGIAVKILPEIPGMPKYNGPCLQFNDQAQFHPLSYLKGLCKAIIRMGGKVYSRTRIKKIDATGITTMDGFEVKATHIIITSSKPALPQRLNSRIPALGSYMLAGLVRKETLPKALWWDTADHSANSNFTSYRCARVQPYDAEYDLLLTGIGDFPVATIESTKKVESHFLALESWTRKYFPVEQIISTWSLPVAEPFYLLPFVASHLTDADHLFTVKGDSGNGMTQCVIAALMVADKVLGRKNPYEHIYHPSNISFDLNAILAPAHPERVTTDHPVAVFHAI